MPGSLRASMVLPEPGVIGLADLFGDDMPDVLEIIDVRQPRAETGSQWAARLQRDAPCCACGCGDRIRLRAHHRTHGIPKYIQGHHSTPLRKAYQEFRNKGYVFLGELCRELGISTSAYRRMEAAGKMPKAPRHKGIGGMMVRVFRAEDVARLEPALHPRARAGNG
jgi:hypothetical protein